MLNLLLKGLRQFWRGLTRCKQGASTKWPVNVVKTFLIIEFIWCFYSLFWAKKQHLTWTLEFVLRDTDTDRHILFLVGMKLFLCQRWVWLNLRLSATSEGCSTVNVFLIRLTIQHESVQGVLRFCRSQRRLCFLENDAVEAVGPCATPEQVPAKRPSCHNTAKRHTYRLWSSDD